MANTFKSWGSTLKDLAEKLFGNKKEWSGLNPGDPGYLQHVFGIEINEKLCRPEKRPPVGGLRFGQIQVKNKVARKGHRMKKRRRQEGPYACQR